MKEFFIYIVLSVSFSVTAFAQSESFPIVDISSPKQVLELVPVSKTMSASNSFSTIYDYPNRFDNNMLFISHFIKDAAILNHNLSISYHFKHFTLTPYNQRFLQLGIADINKLGGTLIWKTNKRLSFGGSVFFSKQYGYMFSSKHTSLGLRMGINYQLNSQLVLSLWGQYLLNRNNDPFIRSLDTHPKTGAGFRIEYNPNKNTTLGIDAGVQEGAFENNKLNYSVEGKARIKF